MKIAGLAALALCAVLVGATCVPLIDLDAGNRLGSGSKLEVSAMKPAVSRSVPSGAQIEIEWTAVNLTGSDAVGTVIVRSRRDFTDTILEGGLRLPESGGSRVVTWDTTGFEGGEYSILVRVEAGTKTAEDSAPGRITINTPPTLEFTEPTEDVTLGEPIPDPNDPNNTIDNTSVTIRWTSFDPDGDGHASIGVDPDLDHTSGNEVVIQEVTIPAEAGFDSMAWDGTDVDGQPVDPGTYHIFAGISDDLNETRYVDGLAQITVPEEPNEPNEPNFTLGFTEPAEDTEFLRGTDPLKITFTLDEPNSVLVDIEIDPDDNHRNGNERTILSQRLVDPNTHEDSFEWGGLDSDDKPIVDGIYRLLLIVNRGTSVPQIVESDALVFRRGLEGQPLISLLEPATDKTVKAGDFVFIKWRDDDPNEAASIRLFLDDDSVPLEQFETGDPEIEILPEPREAAGDGVLDTFNYRVESSLAPGRYYIFAYIDRDDAEPIDDYAIAGGQIVIEDPNSGG